MKSKNHIPLAEFASGKTQEEIAAFMDRSQGAINQMLKAQREVYIIPDAEGDEPRWYEIVKPRKTSRANTDAA